MYIFYVLFLVVLHNMWICMWITMWIMFRYCYMYYCIIILIQKSALPVQIQNQNICLAFGNLGKYRLFVSGGIKNQNKCSVFPAAYKLLHLHTNLKIKPLKQNIQKSNKIPIFNHPVKKSQYRPKYR